MMPFLQQKKIKTNSSVPTVNIDKQVLEFFEYLTKKRFYVIFCQVRRFYKSCHFPTFYKHLLYSLAKLKMFGTKKNLDTSEIVFKREIQ